MLILISFSPLVQAQDATPVQSYASTLGLGELLQFGDRSIKFKNLIPDSRCPADVTCIWAGEAKILVEVFEEGKSCGEEIIIISGGGNDSASLNRIFSGADFSLVGLVLKPYPKTSRNLKPSDYTLTLEVKEEKKGDQ
ncbi:hypothetical protein [Salinimicrobium sp. GXAS 041]|uniref:hypothetical protein n=1 Tax=Salinimicrobium sp. GXAS 041 TaxID=3400806 RepID=UPI003C708C51